MIKLLCVSVLRGGYFLTYWAIEFWIICHFHSFPVLSTPTPPPFPAFNDFCSTFCLSECSIFLSFFFFFPCEYWLGSITCFDQRDVSECGMNRSLKCTYVVWLAHITLVICHKKNMPPVAADSRRMWRHLEWTGIQRWTWS